jgi:hypothetical protein
MFSFCSAEWTADELCARVQLNDRAAALKALAIWVDKGVLRDAENGGAFVLLEQAEMESAERKKSAAVRSAEAAVEEPAAINAAQQQQAEQMKMYWKVGVHIFPLISRMAHEKASSSRACCGTSEACRSIGFRRC